MKLYEDTFAAMRPGRYYVYSDDGEVLSSYWKWGQLKSLLPNLPPKVREQRSFSQSPLKPNICRMITPVSSPVRFPGDLESVPGKKVGILY